MGLFKKIANALKKTKEAISRKFDALLSGGELNDEFYEELEDVLISSDVGAKASIEIVDELRVYARKNKIRTANDVRAALKEILISIFDDVILVNNLYWETETPIDVLEYTDGRRYHFDN